MKKADVMRGLMTTFAATVIALTVQGWVEAGLVSLGVLVWTLRPWPKLLTPREHKAAQLADFVEACRREIGEKWMPIGSQDVIAKSAVMEAMRVQIEDWHKSWDMPTELVETFVITPPAWAETHAQLEEWRTFFNGMTALINRNWVSNSVEEMAVKKQILAEMVDRLEQRIGDKRDATSQG